MIPVVLTITRVSCSKSLIWINMICIWKSMFCYIQDQVIHLFCWFLPIKIGLDHNDPDTSFWRFDLIREPKSGPVSQYWGQFFTPWAQQRSMWVQLWMDYHCFGIKYIKWPHQYILSRMQSLPNSRNLQVPTTCTFTNLPKLYNVQNHTAISYKSTVTPYWNILQKQKEILSKRLDVAEQLHTFLSFDFITIYTQL